MFVLKSVITSTVTIYKNGNIISQLEAQLAAKRQDNASLTQQLYEVKTNRYIEEQARDSLGLLKDGEFAVLAAQDQKIQNTKLTSSPTPNYKKWLKLFF